MGCVYTRISTVQGTATAQKQGGLKGSAVPLFARDLEGVLSVRLSCVFPVPLLGSLELGARRISPGKK